MTTLLDSMPKSCPRQDAAMARALRQGVRFKMQLNKDGWRVTAKGPGGAATMLLPRQRKSILGPLIALCGMVGTDNSLATDADKGASS